MCEVSRNIEAYKRQLERFKNDPIKTYNLKKIIEINEKKLNSKPYIEKKNEIKAIRDELDSLLAKKRELKKRSEESCSINNRISDLRAKYSILMQELGMNKGRKL